MTHINIRFYEELNDFLPPDKKKQNFSHHAQFKTTVKDIIESLGVPHTEVDLIIVNNKSVDFTYQIKENDSISVYPVFEAMDISPIVKLRKEPLRKTKFILDGHLGKLAKYLRLLGFDVVYQSNFNDEMIIDLSVLEHRIILTRDIGLLKNKRVTHGYWMRNTHLDEQALEVLKRFDLFAQCKPFTRCLECNGILEKIPKEKIQNQLPPLTRELYHHFMHCTQCEHIYWEGSHYQKLEHWIHQILQDDQQ